MNTEAINHDPAITFIQTGSQLPGRPEHGLVDRLRAGQRERKSAGVRGSEFAAEQRHGRPGFALAALGLGFSAQPLSGRTVPRRGRSGASSFKPAGHHSRDAPQQLDALAALNRSCTTHAGDPEIETRIAQYEMAFRMQTSVPDLADTSNEPEHVHALYGDDSRKPGTFAANCLLARRLAERNVRFIQLYHRGWDHHGGLTEKLPVAGTRYRSTLRWPDSGPETARDARRYPRHLGRRVRPHSLCAGPAQANSYGRDHHGRVFSLWMAGGGVKRGYVHGSSDDYGFNVAEGGVHIHDLQATILHLLGIDHEKLTYLFQGRHFRLTDVAGRVVKEIVA